MKPAASENRARRVRRRVRVPLGDLGHPAYDGLDLVDRGTGEGDRVGDQGGELVAR